MCRIFYMKKLLILCIVFISVPFLNAQSYKFIVWGDSQFQNPEVFEEIVKETELLKPAFVIHVGDMIHGYTYDINNARRQWKRFKKQIAPLTVPFYPTPGNHDVTTKEIQPAYLEAWGKDKLYYSFDYKNSHFIILNVFLDQQFDTIPNKEFEWLKKDLEKAKNADNIFLSFHSPLYLNKNYNWQPVQALLKQYNVKGIFTGHYHIYDYRLIDSIPYFCINSSGNMNFVNHLAGHTHGFLYVTVDGSKVDYAYIVDGKIYAADAVKPDEYKHSPKFFKTDKTIIISDPAINGIDTTIKIDIKNDTDIERHYKLTWETNTYKWDFIPWGDYFSLKPKEDKKIEFSISGPKGNFLRSELPKLRVESPYTTLNGAKTESIYYYHLFTPPITKANFTNQKITIDGIGDEAAWKNDYEIDTLYVDYKKTPAKDQTIVKVLYDNSNLYVNVKGDEPNPSGLASTAYGDIPLVFGDDDFELFFDTNRDLKTFYRLMVNPKGTILCSGPKGLFTFKFEVKTYVGNNYWSAEFKIPLSEINAKINKGDGWGFNFRRHRQQAEPAQSDWSKMQEHPPYQPEYFGLLKFN